MFSERLLGMSVTPRDLRRHGHLKHSRRCNYTAVGLFLRLIRLYIFSLFDEAEAYSATPFLRDTPPMATTTTAIEGSFRRVAR